MLRSLHENLILKLISLAAAVVMWVYVSADRYPNVPTTRIVNAEVKAVGQAPDDLIVTFRQDTVPVTITGPKSDVDAVVDNEIKAEFPVSSVKPGTTTLRGRPIVLPNSSLSVVAPLHPVVGVDVAQRDQKSLTIMPVVAGGARDDARMGSPHLSDEMATVRGRHEDLQRIRKLVVYVEPGPTGVDADLPIKALDRDGIEVTGVDVTPKTTHVTVTRQEPPATRTLVVNVALRGQVAYPYVVSDIVVDPPQVTVSGKPDQLLQLTNVPTQVIELSGLMSDFTRDVPLVLPPGITTADGRRNVRVTVRVRDTTRTGAGP